MDGILDRVLEIFASRPTLILYKPLAATWRERRAMLQEVSPESAEKFVKRWSEELAKGWVKKFFPDLPEEERKSLAERIQRRLIESI
jgi:transketolase